mmetsp:Transcript_9831/g.27529  ORF Transcript_9831/g.27529 Transcript_9831/m.27529 type:complete len:201 (-) Transcript_9831:785-1387(-)
MHNFCSLIIKGLDLRRSTGRGTPIHTHNPPMSRLYIRYLLFAVRVWEVGESHRSLSSSHQLTNMHVGPAITYNANIQSKVLVLFQGTAHRIVNPFLGIPEGPTAEHGEVHFVAAGALTIEKSYQQRSLVRRLQDQHGKILPLRFVNGSSCICDRKGGAKDLRQTEWVRWLGGRWRGRSNLRIPLDPKFQQTAEMIHLLFG